MMGSALITLTRARSLLYSREIRMHRFSGPYLDEILWSSARKCVCVYTYRL